MSVGFGFSVGDFIAAINLVGTVIDALSNSSKSSSELQELLRQLYSLQIALDEVNSIRFSDQLHAELLALRQAAAQCQLTISAFLAQVASYQPHLVGIDGGSNSLQRGWKKIQWAVCKKKDLVQFQTDLSAHTAAIQIILATIQMKNADIDNESQQNLQKSVASQLQEGFSAYMRKFSSITGKLDGMIISMRECLHNTRRIISTNIQVFQVVLEIQNILKTIPGQIERQKPVYLNDALGRYAPFYLEFIMSPEALISVLAINFKSIGRASRKIENGQFIIHDSRTKRDIDLSHPWESCFRPGQRVEMSMVFDTFKAANISCPDCRHPCDINSEEDVECEACGLSYRSTSVPEPSLADSLGELAVETERPAAEIPHGLSQPSISSVAPLKRHREDEEDLAAYRRVRLRVMNPPIFDQSGQARRWRVHVFGLRRGRSHGLESVDIGDDGFESLGIGYGWLGEDKGIIYCKVVSDFGVCIFDLAAHAMRVLYRVLKGLYVWVNLNEYAPTEFCEYALKFEKDEDRTMFCHYLDQIEKQDYVWSRFLKKLNIPDSSEIEPISAGVEGKQIQ